MNIDLPDLNLYKQQLTSEGAVLPLNIVRIPHGGLLSALPAAEDNKTGWPWTEQVSPDVYSNVKHWPKLTIVTPSYNQADFLEQTIRAVLLQNYPNLEFIIIDGGSSDTSKAIIEKYSPWISFWKSAPDNGQSHAINQGFSIASGEYLAWINSDDYYLPNTFYKVINKFLKTRAKFVYGYTFNYSKSDGQFKLIKVSQLIDYFIRIPTLAQPSCFWSAEIHQPLWEQLHCSLDFELWQRLVKGHKRTLIKEPLSVANVHDAAKTSDPKMGAAWAKDHQLICDEKAHGPVYNWATLTFLNRFWVIYNRLIS